MFAKWEKNGLLDTEPEDWLAVETGNQYGHILSN